MYRAKSPAVITIQTILYYLCGVGDHTDMVTTKAHQKIRFS